MVPNASFHILCHDDPQNDPKIGLGRTDPVQIEENDDHHRISHDLKPNIL